MDLLDPQWTKDSIKKAAEIIGVSRRKIYKWGYDRKSKPKYKSESTVGLESQFNCENMGKLNDHFEIFKEQNIKIKCSNSSIFDYNKEVDLILQTTNLNQEYQDEAQISKDEDLNEDLNALLSIAQNKNSGENKKFNQLCKLISNEEINMFHPVDSSEIFNINEFELQCENIYENQDLNDLSVLKVLDCEDIINQSEMILNQDFHLFKELYESEH